MKLPEDILKKVAEVPEFHARNILDALDFLAAQKLESMIGCEPAELVGKQEAVRAMREIRKAFAEAPVRFKTIKGNT
jgi:hypothetical protein